MKQTLSLLMTAVLLASAAALLSPYVKRHHETGPASTPQSAEGALTLELVSTHGLVSTTGSEVAVKVDVTARADEHSRAETPVAMALVLDRSGSMEGEKMQQLKRAAQSLVDRMRDGDRLALVDFSSDVHQVSLKRLDPEARKEFKRVIEGIVANGGTNISDALAAAQRVFLEASSEGTFARRVVLISDGLPTEGLTSPEVLAGTCRTMHGQGLTVSALGVGLDFNSRLMQSMAGEGGGFSGFLEKGAQLDEVLDKELQEARSAAYHQVALNLRLPEGVELLDVSGRQWQRAFGGAQVPLPDLAPGATAQVFVRLKVHPEDSAASMSLVQATLGWVSETGAQASPTLTLAAGVTDDPERANESRVEAVYTAAVRAMGSVQLLAAAEAFERGDQASALSLLDSARGLFGQSADALAGETEVLRRTEHSFRHAKGDEAKRVSKDLESKSLRDFGVHNGY
jgi:Ca-activated chloride channel family protein